MQGGNFLRVLWAGVALSAADSVKSLACNPCRQIPHYQGGVDQVGCVEPVLFSCRLEVSSSCMGTAHMSWFACLNRVQVPFRQDPSTGISMLNSAGIRQQGPVCYA